MTDRDQHPDCIAPDVGALLVPYALGTLSPESAAQFELHLLECTACQVETESALTALDTLASTRTDIISRAQDAGEDFESQFAQLRAETKRPTTASDRSRERGLLDSIWAALWGRRWLVGTAFVAVIAVMFVLRRGPSPLPTASVPHAVSPSARAPSADNVAPSASAFTLPPAGDSIAELYSKELAATRPRSSTASPYSHSQLAIPRIAAVKPSEPPLDLKAEAQSVVTETEVSEPAPTAGALPQLKADRPASVPELLSKQPGFKVAPEGAIHGRTPLTDRIFGPLNPRFVVDQSIASTPEPSATNLEARAMAAQKTAPDNHEMVAADRLLLATRYVEAQAAYSRLLLADSSDAAVLLRAGTAALGCGDFVGTRTLLERASSRLTSHRDKDLAFVLRARLEVSLGNLQIARSLLADSVKQQSLVPGGIERAVQLLDSEMSARGSTPPR
jgi:hypothetical protein